MNTPAPAALKSAVLNRGNSLVRAFFVLSLLFLITRANAANGTVRFEFSDVYVYEGQVSATIGVVGEGGTLGYGATIAANTPSGTPSTTATRTNDYTATASFPWGPTGNGYGYASIGTLDVISGNVIKNFTIGIVDNAVVNSEKQIGLIFWSTSRTMVSPTECVVHILDDDTVISISTLVAEGYEQGEVPAKFLVRRVGDTGPALTVAFTRSGTATHGAANDYTISTPGVGTITTDVTIPAGAATVEVRIFPNDDAVAESTETVALTLTSSVAYKLDPANTSATVSIIDNDPVVSISGTDTNATEGGDTALLTVTRTADPGVPLTVRYLLSGTAGNGVDYAVLSNSVVIPGGEASAAITIAPLFDYLVEGIETVTLTLITNVYKVGAVSNATINIADFDDSQRKPPLLGGVLASTAHFGRFVRGTGLDPGYHSFVVPVDFQQGVPLNDSGGNANTLFPGNSWTTTFNHYNATTPGSPIPFSNPIAAFGGRVGGSPLYFDQGYSFGIYAGEPKPAYTNANAYTNALRMKVYNRGDMSLVATTNLVIPHISNTNEWVRFLT
ncbi:MAG TPA: Calx-beta domain-containing protein, partial [Candidatus Acidoferrum sp.]|nr:Calx-beta domain-containing protein [Candidatus Acidoferrum sp.]